MGIFRRQILKTLYGRIALAESVVAIASQPLRFAFAMLLAAGQMGVTLAARAQQFPLEFELSSIDGTNGIALTGIRAQDHSGIAVAGGKDLNGDGFNDVIIGAPGADPGGKGGAGQSYVIFGTDQGFPAQTPLSALDGTNGFAINGFTVRVQGMEQGIASGSSVAGTGDVNGDGIGDVIIGAPRGLQNGAFYARGQSFVVFGTNEGFPAAVELSALDGTNGIALNGVEAGDQAGNSVAGAGDVNGDGLNDVIIGARTAFVDGSFYRGASYVVFGKTPPIPAEYDLANLSGLRGFAIQGINDEDELGSSVAGAGDINGDGFDDVIIGAPEADPGGRASAGQSYVVFGTDQGFPAALDLSSLDGTNGFALNGVEAGEKSGRSVAGAGDVNGDGIDDIIVGAEFASPNGLHFAGRSYVVFGTTQGFSAVVELSGLDGTNGFALNGIDQSDFSGSGVAGAGDINIDGIDDIIIGATHGDPGGRAESGEVYVVFGTDEGFPEVLELSTLDGSNGFTLNGAQIADLTGVDVDGTGDFDGDGVDDIIIGAWGASPGGKDGAGRSYVVFERPTPGLTVSGLCPGEATVNVSKASPGGSVAIASAANEGNFTIGGGVCAGTVVGLDSPVLEATATADANGVVSLALTLNSGQCGWPVQALDWTTCLPSQLATYP